MTAERVRELNRRIKAKLEELDSDLVERRQAEDLVARKEAKVDELKEALRRARKRIDRRRDAIAGVRAELRDLATKTPNEDTEEEVELRSLRDQLAGELEESISTRDLILAKLDRLKDQHNDARIALAEAVAESREDRAALDRMRERRERIRERTERPSPNFSFAEFDCNDATPLPKASEPAVRDWCQRIGEELRERFGTVTINSAFRHRAYNERIGGEDNSVHIYDFPGRDHKAVAVDFRCEKGTPAEWYAFTAGKADGRGLYATFHHADTRNRIGWADATWKG